MSTKHTANRRLDKTTRSTRMIAWYFHVEGESTKPIPQYRGRRMGFFVSCVAPGTTEADALERVKSALDNDGLRIKLVHQRGTVKNSWWRDEEFTQLMKDFGKHAITSGCVQFDTFHTWPIGSSARRRAR